MNRVLQVVLTGNATGLRTTLAAASRDITAFEAKTTGANGRVAQSSGKALTGVKALAIGAGVLATGMGMAVGKSMQFETAMSAAGSATQAAGKELSSLRDAAVKAGADSQYSATEAAQAITEMGKAGVASTDILGGGLKGALDLAAAGQVEVGRAAELSSIAMVQFNLAGKDLPHVADLLAAGAGKAMGSVDDLGAALGQAGLVASAAGMDIEETTGTLAAFAAAGLVGSDAGTSMKTMLQMLQAPSKEATRAMEDLGIQVYDSNGEMLGMSDIAGELQTSMGHLTDEQRNTALATIFGADAVRAANVLYKEGAAGISDWTKKVNDSGYASKTAAELNDNLKGDLERLGGAFDTLMISLGSGTQGPLRALTQGLTDVVDAGSGLLQFWSDLPGPVQNAVIAVGLFLALRGPLSTMLSMITSPKAGGAMETIALHAMTARDNIAGATTTTGKFSAALGGARGAAAGLVAALGPLAAVALLGYAITSIVKFTQAGDSAADSVREINDEIENVDNNAQRFQVLETGLESLRAKAEEARAVLDGYDNQNLFNKYVWSGIGEPGELRDAEQSLEDYNAQIREMEQASQRGAQSTDILAESLRLSKDEVAELADKYGIDLTGDLENTQRTFREMYTEEYGTTPTDAANAFGEAVLSAKTQTEEAIKAQEEWIKSLAGISDAFVDPLSAYQDLLSEKQAAEQASAEATAASTESSTDSWEDYVDDVDVSLTELADRLQTQIDNQMNWRNNIASIAQWAGIDVAQHLASMGQAGVEIVAKMADGSSAEAQRMAELLRQDAALAGTNVATELDLAWKVAAEVGKQGATATARSVADALQIGVGDVAAIAAQYGIKIADGVNPILQGLGKPTIQTNGAGPRTAQSGGGVQGRNNADGNLYEQHQAEIAPGGVPRIWAEPETGGEAYIPLSLAKRARSVNIWRETGKRLGVSGAQHFANGGFTSSADVPQPFSTAPFASPISPPADAAMQKGFDEVRSWLDANAETLQGGTAGNGAVTGAWGSLWQLVKTQIPQARINSTFRAGDPGYHGKGKAIDFGFGSGPGGAGSAGLASINRLLHDQVGGTIAQLIYDGIGDDRPDLLMGRPHNYGAGTQAEHRNHVHAAVRDSGGLVRTGTAGLNLSGFDERVLSPRQTEAFEQWMASPAAQAGYGDAAPGGRGGNQSVIVRSTVNFNGPVYGEESMKRIAQEVVTARDQQLQVDSRRWGQ